METQSSCVGSLSISPTGGFANTHLVRAITTGEFVDFVSLLLITILPLAITTIVTRFHHRRLTVPETDRVSGLCSGLGHLNLASSSHL